MTATRLMAQRRAAWAMSTSPSPSRPSPPPPRPNCRPAAPLFHDAGLAMTARQKRSKLKTVSTGSKSSTEAPVAQPASSLFPEGTDLDGLVLAPLSEGEGWWDDKCAAMPVVIPPEEAGGTWRMWYYGRDGETWAGGRQAFLPTGVCGYAESTDGLRWTRVKGPLEGGAVLAPSQDGLDSVHVGVSDVIVGEDGQLGMLYLGGSGEKSPIGEGMRMRVFSATSADGLQWERTPLPALEPGQEGEWDANFATWGRAVPVDTDNPSGPWLLHYHALERGFPSPAWAAGVAFCAKREDVLTGPYEKAGKVLEGGPEGSWDELGVGTRHVIHHQGALWMIFEAVTAGGGHSLGLACSADGGRSWEKRTPDSPCFEARCNQPAWDSSVVGTPYVVRLPGGGGFRLYYVGTGRDREGKIRHCIGAADSVGDSLLEWTRVAALM